MMNTRSRPSGSSDSKEWSGLLDLHLISGNRAMLEAASREHDVTDTGGNLGGTEIANRLNAGLTVRIHGRHALGLQYTTSTRDVRYPERPDNRRTVETVSPVDTLLGSSGFAAAE